MSLAKWYERQLVRKAWAAKDRDITSDVPDWAIGIASKTTSLEEALSLYETISSTRSAERQR